MAPARRHSEQLITLSPAMTLKEAAIVMNDNRITGAPVTEGGRLVGVLSRSDLLRAIASGPCDGSTDGDISAPEGKRTRTKDQNRNDQPPTCCETEMEHC